MQQVGSQFAVGTLQSKMLAKRCTSAECRRDALHRFPDLQDAQFLVDGNMEREYRIDAFGRDSDGCSRPLLPDGVVRQLRPS